MTSGLRKIHKYMWLFIVLVIPTLIVFSITDLDIFSSENNTTIKDESSSNTVVKAAENDLIRISLLKGITTNSIEIILKSTLKHPSSIVYSLNDNDVKGALIGQITTVGIYRFESSQALKGVIIYDALKEEVITKLRF